MTIKPIEEIPILSNSKPIIVKPTPTPPKKVVEENGDDKKIIGIDVKIKDDDN